MPKVLYLNFYRTLYLCSNNIIVSPHPYYTANDIHVFYTQMISQNQESFIGMLNAGSGSDFSVAAGQQQQQQRGDLPPSGQSVGGPGLTPMSIQVTPQEKEAIDRVSFVGGIGDPVSRSTVYLSMIC